jgi:hypothetical protein
MISIGTGVSLTLSAVSYIHMLKLMLKHELKYAAMSANALFKELLVGSA